MFRFRSVKSIVMAPAKTGRLKRRRIAVTITDHTNNGMRSRRNPLDRILMTVVIKLRAPIIEDTPAR